MAAIQPRVLSRPEAVSFVCMRTKGEAERKT